MELKMPTLNSSSRKWIWFGVIILMFVNSMIERMSISSILKEISTNLCENECSSKEVGFIKSFYYIIVILTSPLFGYLADRINRKYLMIGGLCIWCGFGFLKTFFMTDYWPFVITNGLSAVGMAISTNLGPIILADIFDEKILPKIFSIYSLSVPCGLGLGMLIPNALLEATGDFRNSLRLTPGISLLCAIVIFFTLSDPPRAGSDEEEKEPPASFLSDLKYIITNIPFVLLVVALTSRTFAESTINFWIPQLYRQAINEYNLNHGDGASPIEESDVSYIIGILMIVGGTVGIITGSALSSYFSHKWQDVRTDPLLLGGSTLLTLPFICTSAFVADQSIIASYVLYGFFFILAYIRTSIAMHILIKVVAPSKRGFGLSLQKTFNSAFGSASSSVITGIIIDGINPTKSEDKKLEAIQLSFIPSYALLCIGGVLYTLLIFFIPKEKKAMKKESISIEDKTDIESGYPNIGDLCNVKNLTGEEEGKIPIERNSAAENAESSSVLKITPVRETKNIYNIISYIFQ